VFKKDKPVLKDTISLKQCSGFQGMSASFEEGKPEAGTMDELQFNDSLDALLAGNLSDSTPPGTDSHSTVPGSIMMHSTQAAQLPHPAQGLLTTSGIVETTSENRSERLILPLPAAVSYGGTATQGGTPAYPVAPMASLSSQHQPLLLAAYRADHIASADAASVVSSTASARSGSLQSRSKRGRDVLEVSENEEERDRRRQDRNLREQQRSQKITLQIDHLRDVLAAANVQFKPDKYSTLVSVADYIKQMQERSAALDVEHKKLLQTIARTNEIVNDQYLPASATGENPPGSENLSKASKENPQELFVPNIDYRNIFYRCGVPLAVLSIDGRFLECNQGFEELTGYSRDELLPCEKNSSGQETVSSKPTGSSQQGTEGCQPNARNLSLFNLLAREHMEAVFMAMSEMLKHAPEKRQEDSKDTVKSSDYWTGAVSLSRNTSFMLLMNVSLVRSVQGRPKFFDCSLTPTSNSPV